MHPFPHHYQTEAAATPATAVTITCKHKPTITAGPPVEFGGTDDDWSPEELLVATVANCFVLSFKAIAKASRFNWLTLACEAEGVLEKVERSVEFTAFKVHAKLTVDDAADLAKAERFLHKAESICLITNSLKASSQLTCTIVVND